MFKGCLRAVDTCLIEQQSLLNLGVLPVSQIRIRQEILPDLPLPGEPPDPDFLAGFFAKQRQVSKAEPVLLIDAPEKIRMRSEYVV